jgi:hypothetical protein
MVWNYSEATLLLSWRQSMYLRNMACAVTMVWGLARPRANSSVEGDEQMAPHLPKNFVGMHPLGGEGREHMTSLVIPNSAATRSLRRIPWFATSRRWCDLFLKIRASFISLACFSRRSGCASVHLNITRPEDRVSRTANPLAAQRVSTRSLRYSKRSWRSLGQQ